MKFHMYMTGKVVGPYSPEEITELFGGIAGDTLACHEGGFLAGPDKWRKASLFQELSKCIKHDISEPLPRYSSGAARHRSLRILSTDDDSNIRALLWNMLSDCGHCVEFAKDGEEVFKRLAEKRYDLVILDVNMPKMNGYKVSELLHDKLPNPPKVIIFTGRDLEKERLQFVCSGADAILNKGTGNDRLIATIEGLFPADNASRVVPTPAATEFLPEPQPAIIEEFSPRGTPPELEKETFYGPAAVKSPLPAPVPLPAPPKMRSTAGTPAVKAELPGVAAEQVLPRQLALDLKALKADMSDIRRLLGHIELGYSQLEKQFEAQAQRASAESHGLAVELASDWKGLRRYITLLGFILMAVVLALAVICVLPAVAWY